MDVDAESEDDAMDVAEEFTERAEYLLGLLTRKGIYPYEYMDSPDRFLETELPPQVSMLDML